MSEETKKRKSNHATILGIMTSVATALAVVDWDNLNFHLPSTYIKILIIALPAIGGTASTLK